MMIDFRITACVSAIIASVALFAAGCSPSNHAETLTIAFSNDTMGQIRSCGCTSNDLGGLGRRATLVKAVRDTSENFILLDGGDFFSTEIDYGKQKAELTMKAMGLMKYDGIVLGEKDFSLGLDYIRKRSGDIGLPVLIANVLDARNGRLMFPAVKVVTLPSGLKIGLIGVLSDRIHFTPQVDPDSLEVVSVFAAVRSSVRKLENKVDLIAVLAHMSLIDAEKLTEKVNGIDFILCGHMAKPGKNVVKSSGVYILQAPKEGKYMGIGFATLDKNRKIIKLSVYQQPLSGALRDDEAVVKLFQAYGIDITLKKKADLPAAFLEPEQQVLRPYVTAKKCQECHKEIFDRWKMTKHADAFGVLKNKSRDFDRDCTPCHTTGFYAVGGFINASATPRLINVQCEACHGNGYDHSVNPSTKTKTDVKNICKTCHDDKQSPQFDFDSYWSKIAH